MSDFLAQRWAFTRPSPLGDVNFSYELTSQGLQFGSDAPIDAGSELLRWDTITEAATAVLDMPAGKGGPDMARWVPERMEWLLVSRPDSKARTFVRPLPPGDARDALVGQVRARLGSRWVGEGLPLQAAQQRFRISEGGDTLKTAGLVLVVLGLLFTLLLLVAIVSSVLLLPAAFVVGAWIFRDGLNGLRDALHMANTPTAKAASAALGLVELEGRAVTEHPSAAAASGRLCVWWDVAVQVRSNDDDNDSSWSPVMARHGGSADTLMVEDATGRIPVWLRDADLLLHQHTWETGKDELPESGIALLQGTMFAWNSGKRIRVCETRLELDAPLYVFGTLDEARHLRGNEPMLARWTRALRNGSWRPALLRRLPAPLRLPIGVLLGFLDLVLSTGTGGRRVAPLQDVPPPALDPSALLVWRGRAGRSLIVSDRRETQALEQLRKRSLWRAGIGGAVLCYCLYELINLF